MSGLEILPGNWAVSLILYFLAGYLIFCVARKGDNKVKDWHTLYYSIVYGIAWFIVSIPAILLVSKMVNVNNNDVYLVTGMLSLAFSIAVGILSEFGSSFNFSIPEPVLLHVKSHWNTILFILSTVFLLVAIFTTGDFSTFFLYVSYAFFLLTFYFVLFDKKEVVAILLLSTVILGAIVMLAFASIDDHFRKFDLIIEGAKPDLTFTIINNGPTSAVINYLSMACEKEELFDSECGLPAVVSGNDARLIICHSDINYLQCDLSSSHVIVNALPIGTLKK